MNHLLNSSGRIEGKNFLDSSPVYVEFQNGYITKVGRSNKLHVSSPFYISPGFIDIQVNGYLSVSFSLDGANEPDAGADELTTEKVKKVTEALWKEGVTTYLPTLTTNSSELLLKNFAVLAKAKKDISLLGSIPGYHLEGPYISASDGYRGAHPKKYIHEPDWKEFLEFYDVSDGKILLITLAPELEGAFEFIRNCREKGIVVALGHHNGSTDIIKKAIENGAILSTHLGNGCPHQINRHSNPIWPQLADDRLMISIIPDGFHLPPEILQVFYKTKGAENIIIISDVTSYAGLPSGQYKIKTGETIEKTREGNLRFSGQEGGLYGSASPLSKGVGHFIKATGCSLAEAIQMATINPATLLDLNDRGKLDPGKRADIVLFSMEEFNICIHKTIVEGKMVFQSN